MLFLKHLRCKICSRWQCVPDIYYSINEKLLSNASCASRFKQFILMTPSVSVSYRPTQCKEIIEIYIYYTCRYCMS